MHYDVEQLSRSFLGILSALRWPWSSVEAEGRGSAILNPFVIKGNIFYRINIV
jgi:hypothetical protein